MLVANASSSVATAPTVYGIETQKNSFFSGPATAISCNSTYRLRY